MAYRVSQMTAGIDNKIAKVIIIAASTTRQPQQLYLLTGDRKVLRPSPPGDVLHQKLELLLVRAVEGWMKLRQDCRRVDQVPVVVRMVIVPGVAKVRVLVVEPILGDNPSPGLIVHQKILSA